jgi:hypothetical protein
MTQPIIPPFPQNPANVIQFKVLVLTDGVAVHHDCGITETTIKELFTLGEDGALHPDLVAAAMTSIQSMAAKYNGVRTHHAEQNQQEQPQANGQASTEAELRSGAAETGNANEEAGQVDPAKVA